MNDWQNEARIMCESKDLTIEQTEEFFRFLEEIDNLVFKTGGNLRSRQVIALALVLWVKNARL